MNDDKFNSWMAEVDARVEMLCGLSSADLPDICYRDLFEDGVKPISAAKKAIRNAGG